MKYKINNDKSFIENLKTLLPNFRINKHLNIQELVVLNNGYNIAIVGTNITSLGILKATLIIFDIDRIPTHTFSVDTRRTTLSDIKEEYLGKFGYKPVQKSSHKCLKMFSKFF